jgi:hypothetical protein
LDLQTADHLCLENRAPLPPFQMPQQLKTTGGTQRRRASQSRTTVYVFLAKPQCFYFSVAVT